MAFYRSAVKIFQQIRGYLGFLGLGLFIAAALFLLASPLVALLWRAIESDAWQEPLNDKVLAALWLSLRTTAVSLSLILLLGTPLAYLLARGKFWGRGLVNVLVEMPIVLPPAVAGLGLLVAFGRRGLFGAELADFGIRLAFTPAAVVIAQTFVAMPFYVRAAQIGFAGVDREIEAAALVDGASSWIRFVRITLPLSFRALLSGALTSWARALGEFGATIFFAGSLPNRTQTMTLLIYNIFESDLNAAIWTSVLMIGLAGIVVGLARALEQSE